MAEVTVLENLPDDGVSPSGALTNTTGLIRLTIALASAISGTWQLIKKNADSGVWYDVEGAALSLYDGQRVKQLLWRDSEANAVYHVRQVRPSLPTDGSGTVEADATAYLTAASEIAVSAGALNTTTLHATAAATLDSTLAVTGAATLSSTLAVTGALTASAALTVGTTLGVTGAATMSAGIGLLGTAPVAAADKVGLGVADINGATTAALKAIYEGGSSLLERVNGTAAAKRLVICEDVADDGTIALPVPTTGKVGILDVNEITEWGKFSVQSDGTVTKLDGSTNAVVTDTDTKFAVFPNTGVATIKNRLGSSKPVTATYVWY